MKPGMYGAEIEYDRLDNELRRTYLCVEADGSVFLDNLPQPVSGHPDVRLASGCWRGELDLRRVSQEVLFSAVRKGRRLSMMLILEWNADAFHIADPKQDEFGGFGGRYAALS